MPLYEFSCKSCNNIFERLCRGTSLDKELSCPICGGKDLKRLMSSFRASSKSSGVTSFLSSRCSTCSSSNCSNCG